MCHARKQVLLLFVVQPSGLRNADYLPLLGCSSLVEGFAAKYGCGLNPNVASTPKMLKDAVCVLNPV